MAKGIVIAQPVGYRMRIDSAGKREIRI